MPAPPSAEDLAHISHFAALPEAARVRFAGELLARRYGPRELITIEGEPCKGFYFLRNGRARIFRTGADGREQTFRLIGAGETFNEVPVFDGRPNPASVEAIEPSEAILVPAEAFARLIEQYPAVGMAILRHFAIRLRSFTELVEQISLQTVQQRLARYLYLVAREEGTVCAEGVVVGRVLTQQDLASLVGSVREVVSRTLKVMEDDGIVEVRRREFVIRDLAALGRLV